MTTPVKAWTFTHGGYPKSLQKSALPGPGGPPSPTEVYIRVKAAALNPVDIQIMNLPIWSWLPTYFAPAEKGIGEDFSGVVEKAGAESGFSEGDEVFGITFSLAGGTLQELIAVDTKTSVVATKPQDWSWEQAAALPLVWLTARTTIATITSSPTPPKRIAILGGSSSVGMYAVHLANALNTTILSTCSGRNTSFVQSMGATTVIDYNSSSVPDSVREFRPDAIIDCVGGTSCLGLAPQYVTIVGDKTSRASMGGNLIYWWNPQMALRTFLGRWGLGKRYECVNLEFKKEWLEEVKGLEKGKIAVDEVFGFEAVREAFERLNTGRTRGKVVVKVAE